MESVTEGKAPTALDLVNTLRMVLKVDSDILQVLSETYDAGGVPGREVVSQLIKDYLESLAKKKLIHSFDTCTYSIVGYLLHYPNKRDHLPRAILITNAGTVRPAKGRFYGRRTARVYGKRSIGNVVSDIFLQPIAPVNSNKLNVVIITKPRPSANES